MAGFAVDIGDEGSSFEQPVTMPSTTGLAVAAQGLSDLGRGVFGVMNAQARASKQSEGSINRQLYGQLSQSLDNLKGKSPLEVRTGINSALTAYTNAGGKIDSSVSELVQLKSGVDISYLNYNPQQEAADATIKFMQENPGLMFKAERDLKAEGKPYNPDDVLRLAMGEAQTLMANEVAITSAASGAKVDFENDLKPQLNTALTKVRQLAFAGLAVEQQGGNISPESLVRLRSELTRIKATYTKPSYVTAEQWQGVQSQIDTLDQLLTTVENYDQDMMNRTNLEIMEPIWGALQKQAKEMAKTDPLLAKALLDPKADWSGYITNNFPTIQKSLEGLTAEETVYTELDFSVFDEAVTQAESTTAPDGTITVTKLPPADVAIQRDSLHDTNEIEKGLQYGDVKRRDVIDFANTRANLVKPEDMVKPEQRDNFLAGIGQSTVAIATSNVLVGKGKLGNLFTDEVFAKLKEAEKFDPNGVSLAKARMADALRAQANIEVTAMSGTLADSAFKIAGIGKVEFDLDANQGSVFALDDKEKATVRIFASKHYGGDVTAMIADRGRRMSAFDRGQVEAAGLKLNLAYQQYSQIQRQTQGLKFYSDNLRRLGADTTKFDQMMMQETQAPTQVPDIGTLKNPWQIVWSDDTDVDEKLFESLDIGEYFINRNGDIEQKVR